VRVTPLPEAERRPRRVAVGTFDGVHLGHREVIRSSDTVLTFDPHPLAVIRPEALPKLLDTFPIKRDLIASLGVQELVVIPFDADFAAKTHEQFVDEVLVDALGAEQVSVGENFRFGRAAKGDSEYLSSREEFETRVVPLVEEGGEIVSSSRIRALVADGRVAEAGGLLGAPFTLEGEVVHGDGRGRRLGMPTANVVPDDHLAVPGHGVYAATVDGHPAAVNVGVRPTFDTGRGLVVEAHLIDWEGDLYGTTIRTSFLERLRGERRFDSVDALVDQMWADVARARDICSATVARP
jgi:riboflavin kinase/FMN adenylyltransferase